MRVILSILLSASLLSACSHQAKKVDCDHHLVAINPPTPVAKSVPAAPDAPPP